MRGTSNKYGPTLFLHITQPNANEGVRRLNFFYMYYYRVAFIINGTQLNAWFSSPVKYTEEENNKIQFREMAIMAVQDYLREARSVPSKGNPEALAIWPEVLPIKGVIQPLDAFELK